jgi:hypothetical protein
LFFALRVHGLVFTEFSKLSSSRSSHQDANRVCSGPSVGSSVKEFFTSLAVGRHFLFVVVSLKQHIFTRIESRKEKYGEIEMASLTKAKIRQLNKELKSKGSLNEAVKLVDFLGSTLLTG